MNQKKVGIFLSYISEFIKILSSLLYTPIMLRLLGQSEYGLYQLVNSVVSYLGLLSFGFTASYVRFYSRFAVKNENEEISRLNGMFLTIFSIISLIAILCGIVMIQNIEGIFKTGLTVGEYGKARILMALMVFNLAVTFPNSVFDCITTAHERFIFQRTLTVIQNLCNPFLTLPFLLLGYGSVGMVIITTVITLCKFSLNIYYVLLKMHEKFIFGNFQFNLFKEIWGFTFFIFLNQIIDQINWNVDKFLLGRYLGTTAVAVYGLGAQINTLYVQLSSSISSVFIPRVNNIVAKSNDNHVLTDLFIRIGRIQFMLLSLILSGFVFLGKAFMAFWGGDGYDNSYYVTLLLIIPVTIPLIQNIGIEIQRAKNMHKVRSVVYFFIAIGNVILSFFLIRLYGILGSAAGTAISLFLGNILFMNWYYSKKIGLEIGRFWKNIASFIPALILPAISGAFIVKCVQIKSIMMLIIWAMSYTLVYCVSMWFLGMNEDEKGLVKSFLIRMRKHNTKQNR